MPESKFYRSLELRLHFGDWGNSEAPPMLMIHGWRDHCRNWDEIARHVSRDWHVIAPDLRGHGDSDWALGGNYTLIEFIYDIVQLVEVRHLAPVTILAYSFGRLVSLHYAALYPERVKKLVAIEGAGWSPEQLAALGTQPVLERMRSWIEGRRALVERSPYRYATLEEMIARIRAENPGLSPAQAVHLTTHGAKQNEDASYSWKFDNLLRLHSYHNLSRAEELEVVWRSVTSPTLLVHCEESWVSNPAADGRAALFPNAEFITFAGAGH
ncbi:hypothetical protein AZL_b01690 (plasmid) [Azospirillum sp. B510]|nr:hypothetical protein AZL_b01690 [Azospirillum sp. B510]